MGLLFGTTGTAVLALLAASGLAMQAALAGSGVALKPAAGIATYADGVQVHRPAPMGDYKVLDGRYAPAIGAALIDLCAGLRGGC